MSVVGTPTKSSLAVSRIATGSEPVRPPIDGLTDVPVWTNREATTLREIPGRVLMVGGSAVGVELGQFLARMGAKVTIVQRGDRLLDREDPRVGELTQQALAADGVDVRTGRQAVRARRDGQATLVELDDGATVATDTILGTTRRASYQGIPRVVFADPEIAAVGRTHTQAQQHGITVASAEVDLPEAIARPWTYETNPRGTLGLLADRDRRILVGAWAVAPQAGEWIHTAALAIRAAIPIDTLLDGVAQFPTYSEAYLNALEALPR